MLLLFLTLIHRILFFRKKSKEPTCVHPLSDISRVLVILDGSAPDCVTAAKSAEIFFSGENIKTEIFEFKGRAPGKKFPADEDLFISLVPDEPFEMEYAGARSRAIYKIGRTDHKHFHYDLVIKDGAGTSTQTEVLLTVIRLLKQTK